MLSDQGHLSVIRIISRTHWTTRRDVSYSHLEVGLSGDLALIFVDLRDPFR